MKPGPCTPCNRAWISSARPEAQPSLRTHPAGRQSPPPARHVDHTWTTGSEGMRAQCMTRCLQVCGRWQSVSSPGAYTSALAAHHDHWWPVPRRDHQAATSRTPHVSSYSLAVVGARQAGRRLRRWDALTRWKGAGHAVPMICVTATSPCSTHSRILYENCSIAAAAAYSPSIWHNQARKGASMHAHQSYASSQNRSYASKHGQHAV